MNEKRDKWLEYDWLINEILRVCLNKYFQYRKHWIKEKYKDQNLRTK